MCHLTTNKQTQELGANLPAQAKRTTLIGMSTVVVIVLLLGVGVAALPVQLAHIFSDDPKIVQLFKDIRYPLAVVMSLMNLSVALERIPISMGRTKTVLIVGLIGSWIGQVPGVYLLTKFWKADLVALFTGMGVGYAIICIMYIVSIARTDWSKAAMEAQERAEAKKKK